MVVARMMTGSSNSFETDATLSPIMVEMESPPQGDVIFVSTDSAGLPGRLNSEVLRQLNLQQIEVEPGDLAFGYAIKRTAAGLICFIVTVSKMPTAQALGMNLPQALADPMLEGVRSLWLPLMGTGDGGLSYEESFSIILAALRDCGLVQERGARAVISVPKGAPIDRFRSVIGIDATELNVSPYMLPQSNAVGAVMRYASAMATISEQMRSSLSTTLLFFALAESQSSSATDVLRQDPSAATFSGTVKQILGDRYNAAWISYFGNDQRLLGSASISLLKPTRNVATLLKRANRLAGQGPIRINHLIIALLQGADTGLRRLLEWQGITPEDLLTIYQNARLGQVVTRFNNDVASSDDRLGYDVYATAICDFLTHVETPPPLSISIQAPWGGGKSSLMNLIRDKLDPKYLRDKHRPLNGQLSAERGLSLGRVLRMLDDPKGFSNDLGAAEQRDDQGTGLWTIWFNAWKYETTEQVWAGMVDAIVSQVAERLSPLDREKFLLDLQLSRIDDGVIRKRIYERVVTIWWAKVRAWTLAGVSAALVLIGIQAAPPVLPPDIVKELTLLKEWAFPGGVSVQILLSIYLVWNYFSSRAKIREEPAKFSLSDYIRVPDYNKSAGEIHQIHADLRRVLRLVPRATVKSPNGDPSAPSPIVIFIDDLDRCSPGKVASLVEGVSMLLASDTYRCMFVIGMDPQMVAAALEKAHQDVRQQLPRYERAVPLGWRFMDKFIQLPFTIPPCGGAQFDDYVEGLITGAPVDDRTSGKGAPKVEIGDDDKNVSPETKQNGTEFPNGSNQSMETNTVPPEPGRPVDLGFKESYEVGAIIRKIASYSLGNPREMKRMVNLARFCLRLRAARRQRNDSWMSPDLDQYARWIAMTLRWPDMLRWLQWGADEAQWSADESKIDLVVRRLRILEQFSQEVPKFDVWKAKLKERLNIPIELDSDWACDPKLFEFFRKEVEIPLGKRLSDAYQVGFW